MVKVGSRNIVLALLFALLISSCEKEPILTIENRVEVAPVQKKSNVNKKKRKIKLFKIFRKKKYEKNQN
jgi:ribosomal protein L21